MQRPVAWVVGLLVAQVALLWWTYFIDGLGVQAWHHLASLAGVLALSALLWRPLMRSRAFLAMGVFAASLLATASGFWLLYWKEGIRVDGYQDWGVFWHIVWSWMMLVFFVMHTWINRASWLHFMRRSVGTRAGTFLHVGAYVLLVAVFVVTWSALGRGWFSSENYIPLSLYAWVLFVVPPYGLWTYVRMRASRRAASPPRWLGHWPVRRVVDLALVPASVLAIATGVVLAFFDGYVDPLGMKYVSKYWHVWPSVLFSMLVFVHATQAWPTMKAHWLRLGRDTTRRTPSDASPSRRLSARES